MCLKIISTLAYNLSYQMSDPKEIQNKWLSVTYQQTKGHAGLQAPSVLQVPVTHPTVHAGILTSWLFSPCPYPKCLQLMGFPFPYNPTISLSYTLLWPLSPAPHSWGYAIV